MSPYYPPPVLPDGGNGSGTGIPIPEGGVVGHLIAQGPEKSLMWVAPEAVRGTANLPAGGYSTAVLTDQPLAFWPDASGQDKSGNNRHLAPMNSPATKESPVTGLAIPTFQGGGTNLSLPHYRLDAAAWMNSPSITLEVLLHKEASSGERTIMGRERSNSPCWRFGLTSTGALQVIFGTSGSPFPRTMTGPVLLDGLHHLAFTHDGATGQASLYVDGVAVSQGVHPGGINVSLTSPLTVGLGEAGGSGSVNLYYGLGMPLEGVAMHASALNAARILAHARAAGVAA